MVIASAIWGHLWSGKTIRALCDNMAVVYILNNRQSRDREVMHLIRCLSLIECSYHFNIVSRHIPGKQNDLADALSRNRLSLFRSQHPQALWDPSAIPTSLQQLLNIPKARLDISSLGQSVRNYYLQGLAPSTQRTYQSAKSRYIGFCNSGSLPPLPVSENLLCHYASYLADSGLAHTSIKAYLSAVRHLQISHGLHDPRIGDMPRLSQVMRGIKSHQAKVGRQPKPRLPITPSILHKIRKVWDRDPQDYDHIMLWAACTVCFFCFLRSGEISVPSDQGYDAGAHLSYSDIAVDSTANPTSMQVRIKSSKTDPFRKGIDLYVGRTGNALCPVAAMLSYLSVRGGAEGPLFRFKDGRLLTRERFVSRVRDALSAAGIDESLFAGHSFRIGAATTAAQAGIPDATIQLLGRWKSTAYLLYIKTPRDQLASVSQTLSKTV